jgi:hypothetical protein
MRFAVLTKVSNYETNNSRDGLHLRIGSFQPEREKREKEETNDLHGHWGCSCSMTTGREVSARTFSSSAHFPARGYPLLPKPFCGHFGNDVACVMKRPIC